MTGKIITQEGYDKLKNELAELKNNKLPDIIDKIEKAKEMGDLSENAEYHDAKDQQGMIVSRIREIEQILKTAMITDKSDSKNIINLGVCFIVEDSKGLKKEYTIVGFNEADPLRGKISNESPMGEAFLGKKAGDRVEVSIPRGVINYKIVEIK
jgi:transcription elongation factor GreA